MTKLDELSAREMTRKQFLITLLGGALSIIGFSSFIGIFTHKESPKGGPADYGMRDYGP